MNSYIKQMKDTIEKYYGIAKEYAANVENARNTYRDDFAAEAIKRLDAEMEAKKQSAIETILKVKDSAIESAKKWGELDGNKLNDGDMKLLKLDLTPDQFQSIVDRNKNNGTMCFVLKQYADKHAKYEQKEEEIPKWNAFSSIEVPTTEGKIKAYTKLAESAIAIIQNMTGYGWGQGVGNPIIESSAKNFGEPNAGNYMLYEMIG